MRDIAMCLDHDCPSRETCYRYRATPSPDDRQIYAKFQREIGAPRCAFYRPDYAQREATPGAEDETE